MYFRLILAAIMAGSGIRGQFEEKALLRDIKEEVQPELVITIVDSLFNIGKAEGNVDAGQMIKRPRKRSTDSFART